MQAREELSAAVAPPRERARPGGEERAEGGGTLRSRWAHAAALLGLLVAASAALFAGWGRIPQEQGYHGFADARPLGPIPNAWNVLSNLPFVVTGALGLRLLASRGATARPALEAWERMAFAILYGGIALVAAGSAYYHWAPSSATLVWDRLPMSLAFMSLFALVLGDRISPTLGRRLTAPLVTAGLASVVYWAVADDLRPYALVQGFPLVAMLVLLATAPGRAPGGGRLLATVLVYAAAKAAESLDGRIYEASGHAIPGHAAKHLLAGLGTWLLVAWLEDRVRAGETTGASAVG